MSLTGCLVLHVTNVLSFVSGHRMVLCMLLPHYVMSCEVSYVDIWFHEVRVFRLGLLISNDLSCVVFSEFEHIDLLQHN